MYTTLRRTFLISSSTFSFAIFFTLVCCVNVSYAQNINVASVKFTKTANNTGTKKNDELNYTLLAKNTGMVTLYNIYIVDEAADQGSVFPAKVDYVLPGATAVFMAKRTLKQEDIDIGFFSNQAIFYARDPSGNEVKKVSDDPKTSQVDDPTITFFRQTADLVTVIQTKNSNQKNYTPGDQVLYTIQIKNRDQRTAQEVRVINRAPAGTTITKWSATSKGFYLQNNSGTGDLDQIISLFPGEAEVQYEIVVQTADGRENAVNAGKPLSNTVAVTSTTVDLSSEGDVLTTPFLDAAIVNDLSILNRSAQLTAVGINTAFDYTITVKNKGFFTATGVLINNILPANLTYISHNASAGTATFYAGEKMLTWNVETLDAGETITLKLTVKAKKPGVVSNTATVSATQIDTDLANNISTDSKQIFAIYNAQSNVITPNGDGKNDKFVINGLEFHPEHKLNIFNRWGNEVFRSIASYKNTWDGQNLKDGTYYYLLKIKSINGDWLATNGFITLLKSNFL
ncbi:MAG: DUF11 domain-containing protein [Pedobacter sp.]|nr:MAG: DUF11 domain-containing protein [Pedobacter sp.]